MYKPEALLSDAIPDLIGLIRINRAGLEDRLANQHARFRAESRRADEAEQTIEKAKAATAKAIPSVQKLISEAGKDHKKCIGKAGQGMMGKCPVCDAIAHVEDWLELS